jgi:hypothetical protein
VVGHDRCDRRPPARGGSAGRHGDARTGWKSWEDAGVADTPEPEPTVVEWGAARPGVLDRLMRPRGWQPRVPWLLAGLGALALFGSLIAEWQVTSLPGPGFSDEPAGREDYAVGVVALGTWGVVWLVGATALAVCLAVTIAGQDPLRPTARTIGLAIAAVQVPVLVAASLDLARASAMSAVFGLVGPGLPEFEVALGRGLFAAYAGVVLVGAALWLARPVPAPAVAPGSVPAPAGPGSVPGGGAAGEVAPAGPDDDGPADLAVAPAEPLTHPGDEREWR